MADAALHLMQGSSQLCYPLVSAADRHHAVAQALGQSACIVGELPDAPTYVEHYHCEKVVILWLRLVDVVLH